MRVTTTNIYGSHLHMYEGRTELEAGKLLGHENMGEVVEIGDGVDRAQVGDQVVGLFLPGDPGATNEDAETGRYPIGYGTAWCKGQGIDNGQADVKNDNRQLAQLIRQGKAKPSFIVSHELSLDEAPDAYENFDGRLEGWTEVLLESAA